MNKLIHVKGDATILPLNDLTTTHYLMHVVNCKGLMGAGIAKTIKNKYPEVFNDYSAFIGRAKNYHGELYDSSLLLGRFRVSPIKDKGGRVGVANLFAQDATGPRKDGRPPLSYPALVRALEGFKTEISNERFYLKRPICLHMPYLMGCGLAGGNWEVVESIILDILGDYDIICYDING